MNDLPARFVQTIAGVYGSVGEDWLRRLPRIIAACERRWGLTVLPPFPKLSYNYVAPALRADGTAAVLKIGVPSPELRAEVAALQRYGGVGSVVLLAADADQGVMLLERLHPGTTLAQLGDDVAATAIAAQAMRRLWRPLPPAHPFPTLADWTAGLTRLRPHFDGGTGPFPAALVDEAIRLRADLLASASNTAPVLLHGDLHHENVLAAEREPWLAIDPKGIAGEPAYDVATFCRNPLPELLTWPQPERVLARRLDQFAAALALDRARLHGWALVHAVLSAWWSYEDHGPDSEWRQTITCAELLAGLAG